MKLDEFNKKLDEFASKLEVKVSLSSGEIYDIEHLDIGNFINGKRTKPFLKIVVSNWDVSKP